MNDGCPIDKDGYLVFDALTLKDHIKSMLTKSGIFTDQNYEGSNISTITDIVAYTFNVLMFYLNRTSSESQFSDSQIYENMNRIVKLLDYKPIGNQSATLSFTASADYIGDTDAVGLYTIPRYSFFQLDGIPYSFNEDVIFSKTTTGMEELTEISREKMLYQGKFQEYPLYTGLGNENEIMYITVGDNVIIDHFNIHVYVKPIETGVWEQWSSTTSLYLENSTSRKYEIRYNENKNYEIKFGNDINGIKLKEGDKVSVYYLQGNGEEGEIGANSLRGKGLVSYQTVRFNEILPEVTSDQYTFIRNTASLSFNNTSVSTFSSPEESVDDIRNNAPGFFRSQYRLVTDSDYENYIISNFSNIIHDVKVANNWKYLSEQFRYYYDMGITNPSNVSRLLSNQVLFADSCNFNNIYITAVPKITTNNKHDFSFLSSSQRELILSSIQSRKSITSEVVILDPVYVAVGLSLPLTGISPTVDDVDNTELLVVKDPSSRRDNSSIISDINKIFMNNFSRSKNWLGSTISIQGIEADILAISGLKTFYMRRSDNPSIKSEGLSLLIWNHVYQGDKTYTSGNIILPYFKIPYLYDKTNFSNRILVESETKIYEKVEY